MEQNLECSQPTRYEIGSLTLSVILFCAIAFSLFLPLAYTINMAVLASIGLFFLGRRFVLKRQVIEKSLVGKLPLFFIFFAFSGAAINFLQGVPLASYLESIPFLLAPLIFLTVADSSLDRRILWSAAAVGAFLALFLAIYQLTQLGIKRPEGFALSPISFGNNALLLGAISAMGRYDAPPKVAKRWWYIICVAGLGAGAAASLISQSRGGWPFMFIVVSMVFVWDLAKARKELKVVSIVGLLALGLYFGVNPPDKLRYRITETVTGLSGLLTTGKPADISIGGRFELWRFGLSNWSEAPWIGHGQAGLMERKTALIKQGEFDPIIGQFTALHNEFLQLLMQKGLAGVLGWAAMYVASLTVFYSASKKALYGVGCLGNAGLALVLGSLTFGLTDMNLMLNANRQMFVFLAMVVAAMITVENKKLESNARTEGPIGGQNSV